MNRPAAIVILVAIASAIGLISLRDRPDPYLRTAGTAQGTSYQVIWRSPDGADLQEQIESLLAELDRSLSTYDEDSIISRINRNDPDVVPDVHVLQVLRDSFVVHDATGGAFDPSIAPVVRASGFGPDAATEIDEMEIDAAMKLVGLDQVTVSGERIIKKRPGITFDLNGIAQGYSVDVVGRFLESSGIGHFMIEIGGEVLARGVNQDGDDWRVGIDRPTEGSMLPGADLQAILPLRDRALATSGNYRASREVNGRTYTHCIDPRTGRPTDSKLLSVTVLAPTCALADAYATACLVMGLKEATAFVESRDDLEALFIHATASGTLQTHATPGLPEVDR
jgi:thiamine biosynthesis lipoprotein